MADLTEAEIIAVRQAQVGRYGQCDVRKPYSDSIAFAQAIVKAQREKDAASGVSGSDGQTFRPAGTDGGAKG